MYQAQNDMNPSRTPMPANNGQNTAPQKSYVRLLHASPDAPAVDIYLNDQVVATNVNYKDLTKYLGLQPGNYNVKVYAAGETTNPVLDFNLSIPANSVYTVAVVGRLSDLSLLPIPEPIMGNTTGNACVRFVHLSPCTSSVTIKLEDGTTLFEDVQFTDITKYVCVPEGTYSFEVFLTDSDTIVLTASDIPLEANKFYTAYAFVLPNEAPNLQALLVEEPRM